MAPMTLINTEEFSGNWRENYFSELFSLSTDVFLFFRQFDSAQGKRARENERGARRTLDDSQEKLRQLRVCEQAMNSWKRISLNIFFGFNNGRYVIKRSTSKATYSSDAARRFRPDTIVVN